MVGYKLEADQDFHVVIVGVSGKTMVVEVPDPDCLKNTQVLKKEIIQARVRGAVLRQPDGNATMDCGGRAHRASTARA